MDTTYWLAIAAIAIILIFDYTNGFHDAANIVAQPIASRAMAPITAVLVVGAFEFLGPLLGGTAVANTIGKFIDMSDVQNTLSMTVVLCGCLGAIFWNLATWYFGIPSSSSHALVGGLMGPVVVSVGADHVIWGFDQFFSTGNLVGVAKVIAALLLSPVVGFWAGYIVHRLSSFLLRGAKPVVNKYLRLAQLASSAGLAFSHGANDAQKSMGIITMVLLMGGFITEFHVPFWVILSCSVAITLGILSGGWRIVRTVGFGIYKIRPLHALNGQLTSATVIFSASLLGGPVSTTHVTSPGLMGIGASERAKAVHWSKAREIVATWVLTIPGGALAGIVFFYIFQTGAFVFG